MQGWGGEGGGGPRLGVLCGFHRVEVNTSVFCSIVFSFICPFTLYLPVMPYMGTGQGEKSDRTCKVGGIVLGSTEDGLCFLWDLSVDELQYPP